MPFFKALVVESVLRDVTYTVEADDLDEAYELLERGETILEEVIREMYSVSDRLISGEIEETVEPTHVDGLMTDP